MEMDVSEDGKCRINDSGLPQQAHPIAERASLTGLQLRDALRTFLQNMMATVQSLLNRHDLLYQNFKVRTEYTNYHSEKGNTTDMDMKMHVIDDAIRKHSNGESFTGHQFDVGTVRGFLEDMKYILQAWSNRHQILIQELYESQRKDGENMGLFPGVSLLDRSTTSAVRLSSGSSFLPPDNGSVPDQITCLDQSRQFNQGISDMNLSGHVGKDVAVEQSDRTHQANRVESTRLEQNPSLLPAQNEVLGFDRGKEVVGGLFIKDESGAVFQSSSKLHDCYVSTPLEHTQISVSETHNSVQLDSEGVVIGLPHQDVGKVDSSCVHDPAEEPKTIDSALMQMQGSDDTECNNAIIEVKADESADASARIRHMITQPSKREGYTVESPDWLPKGWITEVKIRGSGNSAGTKDKHYIDPVSNRRFRSKKEVFCFLETGKRGRYKPKSKRKIDEESAVEDKPIVASTGIKNQFPLIPSHSGSTTLPTLPIVPVSTGAIPLPVPVSAGLTSLPPPGIFGGFFVPYRPGQPSDWRAYEGLSGLPIPFFEPFSYPDKNTARPNGSKTPYQGQWFFGNIEKTWKQYPSKKGKCKAVDEDQDPSNSVHIEEILPTSETIQQHSVGDARISCNKSS